MSETSVLHQLHYTHGTFALFVMTDTALLEAGAEVNYHEARPVKRILSSGEGNKVLDHSVDGLFY